MTDDDKRVQEIRERRAKITPAPWAWDSRGDKCADIQVGIAVDGNDMQVGGFIAEDENVIYIGAIAEITSEQSDDANFIAHAPTDIDYLLSRLEALEGERDRLLTKLKLGAELMEQAADRIDVIFPDDSDPEMQRDLRRIAENFKLLVKEE